MNRPTEPATALDVALAIATAVEGNAVALMDAASAVRQVVEHHRDMTATIPNGVSVQ